jgi:putative permease
MTQTRTLATRTIAFILLAVVLGWVGYAISNTLSTFILSFVIAYLIDPLVVILERRGMRRVYGIITLYLVLGVVSLFVVTIVLPFIGLKWAELLQGLPGYLQKGREMAEALKGSLLHAVGGEGWSWLIDTVTGQAESMVEKIGAGAYAAAASVVFNIFNLIVAPILVFFMLFYKHQVAEGIVACIPVSRRGMVITLGHEINASIGGYIRGQMVVSLIVALLSIAALLFLDIDYPVLNGIFAGLSSILPFVGVIIATIPPLFFAYVKFHNPFALGQVLLAFVLIYFVEGYVIKPLVFKKAMEMNPLTTIIAVMACGELLGFWGILFAIPLAAATRITLDHVRRGDFQSEGDDGTDTN